MTKRTVEQETPLQRAAERLRLANPSLWEEFTARLDDYGDGVVEAILKAPPSEGEIYKAQGRARGVREVSELLRKAPQQIAALDEAARKRQTP